MKITKSQLKQIIKEEITDVLNEEGTAPTAVGLPNDIGTPEKLLAGLRALDIEKTDHNQANVIVNFINKSLMKNPSEDVANALRDYKQELADQHGFRDTKSSRDAYRDKAAQAERPRYSSERDYQQNPFFIGEEKLGEDMSPEAQQLYKQGQEFFGKLIEMGKNDHPEAGDILDALDEWASETSFEYVRIKSLY